jgi:hypothetical protein
VHPRHICLELDPESQAILSAGMGPRSRASPSPARTLAAADRLRKRLRSKGIRASYNLQMVPRPGEDDPLSVLHITPLRASRPLALRYLAQRLDLPLDRVVVLALAPQASGSAEGGDLLAGAYCSDMQDLLGGMQQVSGVGGASGCTSRSERPTLQGRACSGLGHQAIDAPADGTCWPACPVYTPSPPPSALTTHAGLPGDAG